MQRNRGPGRWPQGISARPGVLSYREGKDGGIISWNTTSRRCNSFCRHCYRESGRETTVWGNSPPPKGSHPSAPSKGRGFRLLILSGEPSSGRDIFEPFRRYRGAGLVPAMGTNEPSSPKTAARVAEVRRLKGAWTALDREYHDTFGAALPSTGPAGRSERHCGPGADQPYAHRQEPDQFDRMDYGEMASTRCTLFPSFHGGPFSMPEEELKSEGVFFNDKILESRKHLHGTETDG